MKMMNTYYQVKTATYKKTEKHSFFNTFFAVVLDILVLTFAIQLCSHFSPFLQNATRNP